MLQHLDEQGERGGGKGDHVGFAGVDTREDVASRLGWPSDGEPTVAAGSPYGLGGPAAPASPMPHVASSFTRHERARYCANTSVAPRILCGVSTAPNIQAMLA